mmetsp:Transcript_60313/g.168490  ORF Transcript_60313/g.168490 Transcript_60313/m.168490 type:complete len:232 (-) Transcript_60313:198-893(-)
MEEGGAHLENVADPEDEALRGLPIGREAQPRPVRGVPVVQRVAPLWVMPHLAMEGGDLVIPNAEPLAGFPADGQALRLDGGPCVLIGALRGHERTNVFLDVHRELRGAQLQNHEVLEGQFLSHHEKRPGGAADVLQQVLSGTVSCDLEVAARNVILGEYDAIRRGMAPTSDAPGTYDDHLARDGPLHRMQHEARFRAINLLEPLQGLNRGVQHALLCGVGDAEVGPCGLSA